MTSRSVISFGLAAVSMLAAVQAAQAGAPAAGESPWPADVPNFVAPQSGEHPRLFFRKGELPRIKERAATPPGQAIIKRLRILLNGSDGQGLPAKFNDSKEHTDATCVKLNDPHGQAFTLWHGAGYGMLYQLTGEKKYADLGRQSAEKMLAGIRDRDGRYSFIMANGALRAGPSLSALAMAYDLCYAGWDDDFRRKIALEIQNYHQTPDQSLPGLVRGARLDPTSNHWGPQIGGGALACLAIKGDPGVDDGKISDLLTQSIQSILTQMNKGWSNDGWFSQGDGAGSISSDNALVPAIQAWRVAGGKDFVTPRPNVQWMTLKFIMGTVMVDGKAEFPSRGMYTHNVWARSGGSGGGLSGCGTFAQGFGAIEEKYKPALLWLYNHYFKDADEKNGTPFDTTSPYAHRAILALVNWPFEMLEQNPAEVLGRVHGPGSGYIFCRNQWKDQSDLMVSFRASTIYPITVIGGGMKLEFGKLPGATFNYYKDYPDGSAVISNAKGETYIAVDFSRKSGAELLLVILGKGAGGGKDNSGKVYSAKHTQLKLGDRACDIRTWQSGAAPEVKLAGDKIAVGGQAIRFDGEKLVLGQ